MTKKLKTKKPRRDFPLFMHQSGQWCKKVKGKFYYFGTDPVEAEARYDKEKADLLAGKTVSRVTGNSLTVRELVNAFLTAMKIRRDMGKLAPKSWNDYHGAGERLVEFFKDSPVADLKAEDFERLLAKLTKTQGIVSLGNSILRTRIIFKWAFDNDRIDRPVRFGTSFRVPNKREVRKAKQAKGADAKTFTMEEIRAALDVAKQPLRAMILLGINCAFGQTDIAKLPLAAIDLKSGWVTFPRPKTAVPRRCPLWPETVAALKEAIAARPEPKLEADASLTFLTCRGAQWVRHKDHPDGSVGFTDGVAQEFNKVLNSLGIKGSGSFYNLRHVFRTTADGAKDQPAADVIMGHSDGSMAENYRHGIDDERLHAVVNVVRYALWHAPLVAPGDKPVETAPTILPFRRAVG